MIKLDQRLLLGQRFLSLCPRACLSSLSVWEGSSASRRNEQTTLERIREREREQLGISKRERKIKKRSCIQYMYNMNFKFMGSLGCWTNDSLLQTQLAELESTLGRQPAATESFRLRTIFIRTTMFGFSSIQSSTNFFLAVLCVGLVSSFFFCVCVSISKLRYTCPDGFRFLISTKKKGENRLEGWINNKKNTWGTCAITLS